MGGAEETVFKLKDVNKSFGSNTVLKDIDITVKKGEIIGFVGASGAGKTTLLNSMVGFIPVDKGKILAKSHKKKEFYQVIKNPMKVNSKYGFASQSPSFYENLTVRENLEYFGEMYGLEKESVKKNMRVLLRLLDLKTCQYVLSRNLSGGMMRRLDIACAMIHNPEVLILDEPTSDLDPMLRNQILAIVKKINMKGTTVIISSHHLNELDNLCNRIAILKNSEIVALDSPNKLKLRHTKDQKILLESYPGEYKKIIDSLKKEKVTEIVEEGPSLIIKTKDPSSVIKEALLLLEKHDESLIDVKLKKPNLDDVFKKIYSTKKD